MTVSSCSKGFEEKAREIGKKIGCLLEKVNEAPFWIGLDGRVVRHEYQFR